MATAWPIPELAPHQFLVREGRALRHSAPGGRRQFENIIHGAIIFLDERLSRVCRGGENFLTTLNRACKADPTEQTNYHDRSFRSMS
jgi:hypothetical protein